MVIMCLLNEWDCWSMIESLRTMSVKTSSQGWPIKVCDKGE